jgi:hypothetical protein
VCSKILARRSAESHHQQYAMHVPTHNPPFLQRAVRANDEAWPARLFTSSVISLVLFGQKKKERNRHFVCVRVSII